MASENGNLMTSLALSDIIHTLSPSPAPQLPPEIGEQAPNDASLLQGTITLKPSDDRPQEEATCPEPMTEEDVSNYRSRLIEMGLSTDGTNKKIEGLNASSREEELLDMVLALARTPRVSSTQLIAQADVIGSLQMQQEHMVSEMEEERARWEAERNGWERMAEALIAQRNKPGSGAAPSEDLERKCSTFESDNRILRDRLEDVQARALALEGEISKLKPMLLMLPSSQTGAANGKGKGKKRKQPTPDDVERERTPKARTIESASSIASTSTAVPAPDPYRNPYSYSYSYSVASTKSANPYLSYAISTRLNGQPTPSTLNAHVSSSRPTKPDTRPKRRTASASSTLTSDARTEHLLLAARKIGRERAALLAGLMQHAEKEKEKYVKDQETSRAAKESERLERDRLDRLKNGAAGGMYYRSNAANPGAPTEPSTPKKMGSQSAISQHAQQHQKQARQPTFVYVQTPGQSSSATASSSTLAGSSTAQHSWAIVGEEPPPQNVSLPTPGTERTPRQQHPNLPQTPHQAQTPLDSLLSAARSMMSDGDDTPAATAGPSNLPTAPADNGKRRAVNELEEPESPVPKRRRTAVGGASVPGGAGKQVAGGAGVKLGKEARVPSALDVLADQAQVAAALPSQISNARAETGGALPAAHEGDTSRGRRKSTRGRVKGSGNRKGKGRAGAGEGGREVEVEEESVVGEKRRHLGSEGEPEIAPVEAEAGTSAQPPAPAPAAPPPSPPPAPEKRKRGRPRKLVVTPPDGPAPTVKVKEESISVLARRRTPRDRNAPLTTSTTSTSASAGVRTRGMKDSGSAVKDPASTSGKKGKGGKGKSASTAKPTSPMAVPSISPSTPRIIAPPQYADPTILGGSESSSIRTYSPLDEALADHEREKRLEQGRTQGLLLLSPPGSNKSTEAGGEDLDSRHVGKQSAIEEGREHGHQGGGVGGGGEGEVSGALGPVKRWDNRKMSGDSTPEREGSGGPSFEVQDVRVDGEGESAGLPPATSSDPVMGDVAGGEKLPIPDALAREVAPSMNLPSPIPVLEAPSHPIVRRLTPPDSNYLYQTSGSSSSSNPVDQSLSPPILGPTPPTNAVVDPSATSLGNSAGTVGPSPSRAPIDEHTSDRVSLPPRNDNVENAFNGINNRADAGHDSELDGEAEMDTNHDAEMGANADDDLDAEGEDEDDREGDGVPSTWSQVAFSSSDISKLLQTRPTPAHGDEDEDVDAEGEIEDDSEEPSATAFCAS